MANENFEKFLRESPSRHKLPCKDCKYLRDHSNDYYKKCGYNIPYVPFWLKIYDTDVHRMLTKKMIYGPFIDNPILTTCLKFKKAVDDSAASS